MINMIVDDLGMTFILPFSGVPSVAMLTVPVSHCAQHVGQANHCNPQYQQGGRTGQNSSQAAPTVYRTTGICARVSY